MSLTYLCTLDLPDEWFHELSRREPDVRTHRWAASEEPSLCGVQLDTSGVDHVRQTWLWETDVPIATMGGIAPIPMAEHATVTILELAHRMPLIEGMREARAWPTSADRLGRLTPHELFSTDHLDERALFDRLSDGRVGAAAMDVFDDEPLPADSPWWSEPNALITPDVAGLAPRYQTQKLDLLVENITRLGVGQPELNEVDRASGY